MFNGESGRRRSGRRPWYSSPVVVFSALATIGLLVLAVEHREADLPKSGDCPAAATVNRTLVTRVARPSAVSEKDLLGCFYAQGSDSQAVSVSFAADSGDAHPCRHRRPIVISGVSGCDVTGSRGTSVTGSSLLLVDRGLQDQFSTDLRAVTLAQLEDLASQVVTMRPPPVENVQGD